MDAPKFNLGQRVYNKVHPVHGKVIHIFTFCGDWGYIVDLDQPNPFKERFVSYGEDGLRATLEEALQWQEANPQFKYRIPPEPFE